jgi:hypothetical protein
MYKKIIYGFVVAIFSVCMIVGFSVMAYNLAMLAMGARDVERDAYLVPFGIFAITGLGLWMTRWLYKVLP